MPHNISMGSVMLKKLDLAKFSMTEVKIDKK